MLFRPHSFSLVEKNLGVKVIPVKEKIKLTVILIQHFLLLLKIKNVPKHIKEE